MSAQISVHGRSSLEGLPEVLRELLEAGSWQKVPKKEVKPGDK